MSASLDELAAIVAELSDKEAMREAMGRYYRGADRRDAELFASAYHSDGTDDHGGLFEGSAQELTRVVMATLADARGLGHYGWQSSFQIEGDVARVESYAIAFHRFAVHGVDCSMVMGPRVLDRFERRAGEWRIAHRTIVYDWNEDFSSRETWGMDVLTKPGPWI